MVGMAAFELKKNSYRNVGLSSVCATNDHQCVCEESENPFQPHPRIHSTHLLDLGSSIMAFTAMAVEYFWLDL